MVQAIRMPMMGNTMEIGLLAEWVVDEGDSVEEDDVIAVVESEKAVADVVASQDGTLARVDVGEGEEVPPGTVLGIVLGRDESLDGAPAPRSRVEPGEIDGGTAPEAALPTGTTSEQDPDGGVASAETTGDVPAAPGARRLAAEHGVDLTDLDGTGPDGAVLKTDVEEHLDQTEPVPAERTDRSSVTERRVFTSPSTRRLARELGVSLTDVGGTGIGGRVTESDVRAAASNADGRESTPGIGTARSEGLATEPTRNDADALGVTIDEERPLSGVRRTIAARMSRSAREAPHVTLNREVEVERALQTAEELAQAGDGSIGFTDLLVAATVRALERYPDFNAWFEDGRLRSVSEVNVAIAVDAAAGLVTPVIRESERRSLVEIARERRRLTDAVLDGEYSMDDLRGGTFTISNLGMFGVDSFDPIINPPQVAILGVGRVRDGDERSCTLSLSFDHRVVDGADAARFLDALTTGIEAPAVVVTERSAAGAGEWGVSDTSSATDSRAPGDDEPVSMDELVRRDLRERAGDIAAAHDWSVPTFEVHLEDGHPSITVQAPGTISRANTKRLAYAACRESVYAEAITGLRDPEITVE